MFRDFKNWPPYHTLEENYLTNGTLPSFAFGFKSCSLKWKAAPQDNFVKNWQQAIACWRDGQRVVKAIGFDAGPADLRRRNHAGNDNDQSTSTGIRSSTGAGTGSAASRRSSRLACRCRPRVPVSFD